MDFVYSPGINLNSFCNRLIKLMYDNNYYDDNKCAVKRLAKDLYDKGLVTVNQKPNFEDEKKNYNNAIEGVVNKIEVHLQADTPNKLQGEFVLAYCEIFGCSADYLFSNTSIISGNPDVRVFCEATGLSEKAARKLLEGIPQDNAQKLITLWSEIIESNLFYFLPLLYDEAVNQLTYCHVLESRKNIYEQLNKDSLDSNDYRSLDKTFNDMMINEFNNKNNMHLGAYYYKLSEIQTMLYQFLSDSISRTAKAQKSARVSQLDSINYQFHQQNKMKLDFEIE